MYDKGTESLRVITELNQLRKTQKLLIKFIENMTVYTDEQIEVLKTLKAENKNES